MDDRILKIAERLFTLESERRLLLAELAELKNPASASA